MIDFINSSALTKLLANVFVFCVLACALGIASYDTINNIAVNSYVSSLIGGGLMYAGGVLNVHIGGVQALQAQSGSANTAAAVILAAKTEPPVTT